MGGGRAFEERRGRLERNLRDAGGDAGARTPAGDRVPAAAAAAAARGPARRARWRDGLAVERGPAPAIDLVSAETTVKYQGYLRRQEGEVARARRDECRRIPAGFPFQRVPGLSHESRPAPDPGRSRYAGPGLRIPASRLPPWRVLACIGEAGRARARHRPTRSASLAWRNEEECVPTSGDPALAAYRIRTYWAARRPENRTGESDGRSTGSSPEAAFVARGTPPVGPPPPAFRVEHRR